MVLASDTTGLRNAQNVHQGIDFPDVAERVADDPYGIGFMGYVYYAPFQRSGQLRALAIDGSEISPQTVRTGAYVLRRPLFPYSSLTILAEKPQVADFLNYVLSNVAAWWSDHGYFEEDPATLTRSKGRLLEVLLGKVVVTASPSLASLIQAMVAPLKQPGTGVLSTWR
jgi:ABC-type phosphate transport system substrate-binding protein